MSLRGTIYGGKSPSSVVLLKMYTDIRLLKHLKKTYTSLLPAVAIYTGKELPSDPSITLPMPSDPLPKDTPLPISYALEFYAESLLEQGKKSEAAEVFAQLGNEVDRIRASFWDYRRKECLQ
jgi:protein farnesyltransferase/geranylgeranyltransferase type-1 subunit alpha